MDYSARIEFEDADGVDFEDVLAGSTEDAVREEIEVYTAEVIGCGGAVQTIVWSYPSAYGAGPCYDPGLQAERTITETFPI